MSVRFLIVRRIQGDRHHGKQTDMSICSQSIGRYTIVFGKIFCLQYIFWARIWDFCCQKRGWMHVAEISGFRSMYCRETLYNIPWMLLYFSGKYISLWHVRVRKESWLHEFLRERKDLSLFPVISKERKEILYLCVEKTGKWMDLRLDFVEHEQKYYFKDDSVKVTIAVR